MFFPLLHSDAHIVTNIHPLSIYMNTISFSLSLSLSLGILL